MTTICIPLGFGQYLPTSGEQIVKVDYSETIAACDLKGDCNSDD